MLFGKIIIVVFNWLAEPGARSLLSAVPMAGNSLFSNIAALRNG